MVLQKDRKVVLLSRPRGEPELENFGFVEEDVKPIGSDELRLRTIYTSLDPAIRIAMREGNRYLPSLALGQVVGTYSVSEVLESNARGFDVGDVVWSLSGWQRFPVIAAASAFPIPRGSAPLSAYLGILGFTGFAAYVGLTDIGRPQAGETVLITAASGAVGTMAGQLAAMSGARIIGVTSGADRCAALKKFGFNVGIDRKSPDFERSLDETCPNGIDVFFDNSGGAIQTLVLPRMNLHGRVALCGMIADYNAENALAGPSLMPVLTSRLRIQGFNAFDSMDRFASYQRQAEGWLREGIVNSSETIVEGLENAPGAFIALLRGEKMGKLVVQIGADPVGGR